MDCEAPCVVLLCDDSFAMQMLFELCVLNCG